MREPVMPTTQPTSRRPDKPRGRYSKPSAPPSGGSGVSNSNSSKVVSEACSCGASISVPIQADGITAMLSDWRNTHPHWNAEPTTQPPADQSQPVSLPATGTFMASTRPFGFS
jgi:hypothetical protein